MGRHKMAPEEHIDYRMDRKKWLEIHPEDIPMDEENQRSRQHGWDKDGVRQLFAAICLRTCIDYKTASMGRQIEGKKSDKIAIDCRQAFNEDLFEFFTNGMKPKEIEKILLRTPKSTIHNIWKKATEDGVRKSNLAKNTRPILEE